MEAKHWFGIVAMGVVLMGVSFATNQYKAPGDTPDARPLNEALLGEPIPAAAPTPVKIKPPTPVVADEEEETEAEATETNAQEGEAAQKEEPAKPKPAAAPLADFGADGPAIAGRVVWQGKPRKNPEIRMPSDPVCESLHAGEKVYAEQTVIDENNNLANVLVYVGNVPKGDYPVKAEPIVLNQEGCVYKPHVVGIQIGQEIIIRNSDNTTHNVHFKSKLNGDWNLTQSTKGDIAPKDPLARQEVGTSLFKCDIHPWMEARVGVFDHPFFAVSKEDGTFEIPHGLPDGTYDLWAVHEKHGKAEVKGVTIAGGQTTQIAFTFQFSKKNTGVVASK
jgi:plastocyanin